MELDDERSALCLRENEDIAKTMMMMGATDNTKNGSKKRQTTKDVKKNDTSDPLPVCISADDNDSAKTENHQNQSIIDNEISKDVLNIEKLFSLLESCLNVGDLIEGKHILLLIGGPGVGKVCNRRDSLLLLYWIYFLVWLTQPFFAIQCIDDYNAILSRRWF